MYVAWLASDFFEGTLFDIEKKPPTAYVKNTQSHTEIRNEKPFLCLWRFRIVSALKVWWLWWCTSGIGKEKTFKWKVSMIWLKLLELDKAISMPGKHMPVSGNKFK